MEPILKSMYPHRRVLTPLIIGDPGISKTQVIQKLGRDFGVNVVTFILSNTVPSEVSGIRMPDNDTKKMEVFDDMRMASLRDGDILFFDEFLEAPPMLWSACLTLIQDRVMASGRPLPDVFIVAASNKVATPGIIPASVRDRFQVLEVEFDWANWCRWFECEYGVKPSHDLRDRIEGDSDQYNILTPRRITKLYEWMKGAKDKSEHNMICDVVSTMFDAVVSRAISDMVADKPSAKRQIKAAVVGVLGDDAPLPEEFEAMPFKDILMYLSKMPEWPEIEYALSSIELEE